MVIVPVLKTRSKMGSTEYLYRSSLDSSLLKALSNSKVELSMNFVMPSTLNLHSCTVIFGFEQDTTSISPFASSC